MMSSRDKMKQDILNSMSSKFNLKAGMCSWPIGGIEDADFRFCSEERLGTSPYCSKHKVEAYIKDKKFTKKI